MNILLIRMDRLGDLICTLPVDQHPDLITGRYSTQWMISKGLGAVLDCARPPRRGWENQLKFSWTNLWQLTKKLRKEKFDKVILFYAPWWVAAACFFAQIPQRYSPRSRWFQFLFFNKTLRQTRSRSEKHEADYNWELLNFAITGSPLSKQPAPVLTLKGQTSKTLDLPKNYIVLHPGMGGSALNWPMSNYVELAKQIISLGKNVVVTGTATDAPWLESIETPLRQMPNVFWLVGQLDLPSLIFVLEKSDATVAPSTGVIHLAASTGVKTIGLYSPVRVQTPIRWGPRGDRAKAIVPSVSCPATTRCLGTECPFYFCLTQITPEQILNEILK